ncbi:Aerobic glycerol-3-phosphate dehydrogenase [hydrothermal vent metagenome]|uniref:Aerobic glycerol-3-phosphate dehydrogenase n=1 Tax=hydrothermal vent metagenome TaxID=652676 RepID=A0A3B0TC66_9ZZZZ
MYDLLIIGGGINGCGIARDAAGRGLKVALVEQGDLAQGTSSASTKLFHGGLRYLEYYEFRLVREALIEREILLTAMPHISWPLRFVLPHHAGLRPAWLLRLGLFIYDHLGGRKILPPTATVDLTTDPVGAPLKDSFKKAFEYSDCWVEDSRLVVLNARDAADRGVDVFTHTRFEGANRGKESWTAATADTGTGKTGTLEARILINAAGPWVNDVLHARMRVKTPDRIRLVRGSHIVVKKLFDHDHAYIFQQSDGRIVFAIPYETDFTLIGTTEMDHQGDPATAECTTAEADYLRVAVSEYFKRPVAAEEIVWTYSGVRPLYDDGASSATEATRDYILKVDTQDGKAPLLNIFGGKITTYRRLAEAVLAKLSPHLPGLKPDWTAGASLPGGDFPVGDAGRLAENLHRDFPFLGQAQSRRLIRAYGTQAAEMLAGAKAMSDLGEDFGGGLSAREVRWLMTREWARTAEDVLWRRSKLGLVLSGPQKDRLAEWMEAETKSGTG